MTDNLKGNEQAPKPAEGKEEPVKLKIDRLTMTNAKVHLIVYGKSLDVSLGTLEMNNLDDGHGNAIPADQLLSAVLANRRRHHQPGEIAPQRHYERYSRV